MKEILERLEELIKMIRTYDEEDNIYLRDKKIGILYQEVDNLKEFTSN